MSSSKNKTETPRDSMDAIIDLASKEPIIHANMAAVQHGQMTYIQALEISLIDMTNAKRHFNQQFLSKCTSCKCRPEL